MKRGAVILVLATGVALGDPPPGDLVVDEGNVAVVSVAVDATATATLTLHDVGAGGLTLTSIDRDGCDAGITAEPSPADLPAALAAGGTHAVVATCPPTSVATIRRCRFHARAAPAQADFTVLCVDAGTSALGATGPLAFGDVPIGGSSTLPLTITNTTGAAIAALAVHVADQNGDFRVGSPCQQDVAGCSAPAKLAPGDTKVVQLRCTPSQTGPLTTRVFVVADNGGRAGPIDATCNGITGSSGPQLTTDAPLVDVERVLVADDATGTGQLHVTNTGGSDLHVASIVRTGGAVADWSIAATGACASPPCTLAPGTGFDIGVTLDPSLLGIRTTTLQIVSDDPLHPTTSIPLRGTGRAATLALDDSSLAAGIDLGDVPLGGSAQIAFALRNDGNLALGPGTIAVDPADGFTLDTAQLDLAPATTLAVTITCTPTVEGTLAATITATSADALTGSPLAIPVTCRGVSGDLLATPSPIALGEIRTGTGGTATQIALSSISGDALDVTANPALAVALPGVTVSAPDDNQTPTAFTITVDPQNDQDLANHLTVAAGASTLEIPVTGRVVTAAVTVPAARTLGSFCVDQPTASTKLALTSTGTASVRLDAPRLQGSGFVLEPVSPVGYPFKLPAKQSASITVTPLRQSVAGPQTDTIVWATDIAGATAPTTNVSADFISDGGAIAPNSVDYGPVPIHIATGNDQIITVQNCGSADMTLDAPQIAPPGPFHITGVAPPTRLVPTQAASFSIEFSPLSKGTFDSTLTLTTSKGPLAVALHGDGVVQGSGSAMPPGDDDPIGDDHSFYGCGGCSSGDSSVAPTTIAAFAAMCVILLRRRRERRSVH